MPGPPPPPPPPPPMFGGPAAVGSGGPPPPPPPLGGLPSASANPNARLDLLKAISDTSKPKLKKVDPSQIKDRSTPVVPNSTVANSLSNNNNNNSSTTTSDPAKSN